MTKVQQAGESNGPLFNWIAWRQTMQEWKVWRVNRLEQKGEHKIRELSLGGVDNNLFVQVAVQTAKSKSKRAIHLSSTWIQVLPRDLAEH